MNAKQLKEMMSELHDLSTLTAADDSEMFRQRSELVGWWMSSVYAALQPLHSQPEVFLSALEEMQAYLEKERDNVGWRVRPNYELAKYNLLGNIDLFRNSRMSPGDLRKLAMSHEEVGLVGLGQLSDVDELANRWQKRIES